MLFQAMSTLFDIPYSPSPKLAWLRKHNLETAYDSGLAEVYGEKEPWSCAKIGFDCRGRHERFEKHAGFGPTEEDAIIDFCAKNNTIHYSIEQ